MASSWSKVRGNELSELGHPLPRRLGVQASVLSGGQGPLRPPPPEADATAKASETLFRRNSSGESHDTGNSDTKTWFDRSNQNPTATFGVNSMDVDPPFFQKRDSDSSNEESHPDVHFPDGVFPPALERPTLRATVTRSSSADDYRSVIDDLTIENKRLKEELKRYKQFGSNMMRKDKLFEIKVHGLPSRKKRELEATLRDFAANLEASTESSSQCKKATKTRNQMKSSGGTMSKHASSSSTMSRPVDSAYASMSAGPNSALNSSGISLTRPSLAVSRSRSSEQKVQSYLQDIPEGLYPRYLSLTEKDKKKLVVRRLEQLFTGEIRGASTGTDRAGKSLTAEASADMKQDSQEKQHQQSSGVPHGTVSRVPGPAREAPMQFKKQSSRDNQSSNSNGDRTESGGNGAEASGSGSRGGGGGGSGSRSGDRNHTSPQVHLLLEQRPTRPRDLDPDRVQVPSENMEYIRHLGMVPPELLVGGRATSANVSMDVDGWVYLNLLCNLAQLHIINVTPDFIRSAVAEKSAKFQLSPDGRKIRWRGGTEGTRFSSDSGGNSSRDKSTDEDDGSGEGNGNGDNVSGKKRKFSKISPQLAGSSASVHYKPMFVHRASSLGTPLGGEGSSSQVSVAEDSNLGNTPRWDYSGSNTSRRKRRRIAGAIVYYTGAPFCMDLSGDTGEASPSTYLTSTNQGRQSEQQEKSPSVTFHRTLSGSSLPFRPLTDKAAYANMMRASEQNLVSQQVPDPGDSSDEGSDLDFPWSEPAGKSVSGVIPPSLEACGLGGVVPDDHFAVMVVTRRPRDVEGGANAVPRPRAFRLRTDSTTASIMKRLRGLRTSNPRSPSATSPTGAASQKEAAPICVEYVSARMKSLKPVSLPPAAMFYPPFSTSSSDLDDGSESEMPSSEELALAMNGPPFQSEAPIQQRGDANMAYPEGQDLSSSDEEDEAESDDPSPVEEGVGDWRTAPAPGQLHQITRQHIRLSSTKGKASEPRTQSSVATAGGAESGYNSSIEA